MSAHKITLSNAGNVDIHIALNNPTDANRPQPTHSIQTQHSEIYAVGLAGTSNLFVWIDGTNDPIWEGIIPTNIEKAITIYPEKQEVVYNQMKLPRGFTPVTDTSSSGFTKVSDKETSNVSWLWCIGILAIVLMIWFIWTKTK